MRRRARAGSEPRGAGWGPAPRLVLAFGLALAGCDGTATAPGAVPGDAGGIDAAPIASAAAIGQVVASAICEKVDLCCQGEARMRVLGVGTDRASCEASLGSFYGRQYGGAEPTVAAGRARFDVTKLTACLEAYRTGGCSAPALAAAGPCAAVFAGLLGNGETCASGFECASRACAKVSDEKSACAARKPDGAACERGAECASGYCRTALFSGSCSSQPPQGDSCGGDAFWLIL